MGAWQDVLLIATAVMALIATLTSISVLLGLRQLSRAFDPRPIAIKLASLDDGQTRLHSAMREDFRAARSESSESGRQLRDELANGIKVLRDSMLRQTADLARQQKDQLETFGAHVGTRLDSFGETSRAQSKQLFEIQRSQHDDFAARLTALGEANAKASEALKQGVEVQLSNLRVENATKLEQMRMTVDEKLQGTLEQRLGESFKLVSERLEAVHKGLGEMQTLATGVGDLKRVLTNVKSRGCWGEVQLGALLEQVLTPGQFASNVSVTETGNERVEFAIRLPGAEDGIEVLLPIDAKFPVEDYERLQAAADAADPVGVAEAGKALEQRIRQCARDISSKYIHPPRTTDFAIMFLPTEGLYAEVIRQPGLCDDLQRDCRVVVAGPTTLTALLNSLQMGFRTLAIQKRSSEVWQVLGAVKTEFGKFGPALEKVKKKLDEASKQMDSVGVRERAIHRRLRQVEAVPVLEPSSLFEVIEAGSPDGAVEEPDLEAVGS